MYIYPFVGILIGFYTFRRVGLTSFQNQRTWYLLHLFRSFIYTADSVNVFIKCQPCARTSVGVREMVDKPAWPRVSHLPSPSYFLLSLIPCILCLWLLWMGSFFTLYVFQLVIAGRRESCSFFFSPSENNISCYAKNMSLRHSLPASKAHRGFPEPPASHWCLTVTQNYSVTSPINS